jgi:hypothetical protein
MNIEEDLERELERLTSETNQELNNLNESVAADFNGKGRQVEFHSQSQSPPTPPSPNSNWSSTKAYGGVIVDDIIAEALSSINSADPLGLDDEEEQLLPQDHYSDPPAPENVEFEREEDMAPEIPSFPTEPEPFFKSDLEPDAELDKEDFSQVEIRDVEAPVVQVEPPTPPIQLETTTTTTKVESEEIVPEAESVVTPPEDVDVSVSVEGEKDLNSSSTTSNPPPPPATTSSSSKKNKKNKRKGKKNNAGGTSTSKEPSPDSEAQET